MAQVRDDLAAGAGAGPNRHAEQIMRQFMAVLFPGRAAPGFMGTTEGVFGNPLGVALPSRQLQADNPRQNLGIYNGTPPAGVIGVMPQIVKDLINPNSPSGAAAAQVLIHELAHNFQNDATYNAGPQAYEGGAEAFAQRVVKQAIAATGLRFHQGRVPSPGHVGDIPVPDRTVYPQYTPYAYARGPRWLLAGQFGATAPLSPLTQSVLHPPPPVPRPTHPVAIVVNHK